MNVNTEKKTPCGNSFPILSNKTFRRVKAYLICQSSLINILIIEGHKTTENFSISLNSFHFLLSSLLDVFSAIIYKISEYRI